MCVYSLECQHAAIYQAREGTDPQDSLFVTATVASGSERKYETSAMPPRNELGRASGRVSSPYSTLSGFVSTSNCLLRVSACSALSCLWRYLKLTLSQLVPRLYSPPLSIMVDSLGCEIDAYHAFNDIVHDNQSNDGCDT